MSSEIASQKQSFFKPIQNEGDRISIIKTVINSQSLLQVKEEAESPTQLSILKPYKIAGNSTIVARRESGPELPSLQNTTIMFEVGKTIYFARGSIRGGVDGDIAIDLKKIFELQRRNSFRVVIQPKLIKARFHVTLLNGTVLARDYRLVDLSAGGLGLAVTDDSATKFKAGGTIQGFILVGSHSAVDVGAEIKYQRKITELGTSYVHVGCQFTNMTLALNERISYIVNDCHRIVFSKLTK